MHYISVGCGSSWAQSFVYDPFGNGTKSGSSAWQPTYNTKNQYQTIPGFTNPGPTYDADGDLLTDSFNSYTWDADGHVTSITADSTGKTIGLTYDALGRMVEQNQSGTYFQILYTPMGTKMAVIKGQTIQQAFVPLPGGTTAEYLSWGLSYYRHADWLGSERLESSTSHAILQDTSYGPFGEPYGELSGGNGDLSFTGQNKDTDWRNYDFMYREYDPRQSRWISPDPNGLNAVNPANPQSWNRYAYALNNPLSYTDPLGLFCVWDDGSYDSNDDPNTGNKSACEDGNGGTWFNGSPSDWSPGAGDWSGQASGTFAGWAQGINPSVGDFGDPSGVPDASVFGTFTPVAANNVTCHSLAAGQTPSGSFSSWLSGTATAASMTANWAAGTGPPNYDFGPNSVQSQQMMGAYGLAQNVSNFLAGGASSGNQNFGLGGLASSGLNPTAQFVGSYAWSMSLGGGNLNITLTNTTTAWSAFYHLPIFNPNPPTRTGWSPMGRVNQTFHIQVPCS